MKGLCIQKTYDKETKNWFKRTIPEFKRLENRMKWEELMNVETYSYINVEPIISGKTQLNVKFVSLFGGVFFLCCLCSVRRTV